MKDEAAAIRIDLPGGRRELRLDVGPFAVVVTEIPGGSLTEREWRDLELARLSYPAMWGGAIVDGEARLDGRGRDATTYDARHYLAWVRDSLGPAKLLTARKVLLRPSGLSAEQRASPGDLLPPEINFWRVRTSAGDVPLWGPLRAHARSLAPHDEHAEFRIASMGRLATFPFGRRQTDRQRERTAIAWAAIQVLAAHGDESLLYIRTVRPEFQDRVLAVRGSDGTTICPSFSRTEETLRLTPGSVRLDHSLPVVQRHRMARPGYFVDSADAARVLAELLEEGRLTLSDLRPAIGRLVEGESAIGGPGRQLEERVTLVAEPDHRLLAEVLTRPRMFKYLIPLLEGADPLARMSLAEFRARLLDETADAPFSATVVPDAWSAGAWAVLEAAERKYSVGSTSAPRTAPVPSP